MSPYLVRRGLQAIPLLIGITIVTFVLLQMTPGGPFAVGEGGVNPASLAKIEALRARYGLDDPLYVQYLRWLGGIVTGDWGNSLRTGQSVLTVIGDRVGPTLLLTGTALILTVVFSLSVGMISAVRSGSVFDHVTSGLSFVGLAIPSFWLGIMLLYVFSYNLRVLPGSGLRDARGRYDGLAAVWDTAQHLVLPVLVLTVVSVAWLSRYVRSTTAEVLGQDFVRTARGAGLPEGVVMTRHVFKNASLPLVTLFALMIPELFLGAAIVETVFGIPGMGRLFIESANGRDYPVLLGILLIASVLVIVANLLADVFYALIDPRIRYA